MENSTIEWCDHTFNPWEGCTKVSPGCTHCYAETRNKRFGGGNWGKGKSRRRTSEANWRKPLQWNNQPLILTDKLEHRKARVFCASLADWLDDEVPIEWLADLLKLIYDTPNLDWLLLTKRPQNWRGRIQEALTLWEDAPECAEEMSEFLDSWLGCIDMPKGAAPENVWIGTSVEDQQRANERIPELLKIPAAIRFLSVEPMLEAVQFTKPWGFNSGIHWAIFGGESGAGARPCNVGWIRDGNQQCRVAGVKVFNKQLGARPEYTVSNAAYEQQLILRDKKGGDMSEWHEDLRIREFPGAPGQAESQLRFLAATQSGPPEPKTRSGTDDSGSI